MKARDYQQWMACRENRLDELIFNTHLARQIGQWWRNPGEDSTYNRPLNQNRLDTTGQDQSSRGFSGSHFQMMDQAIPAFERAIGLITGRSVGGTPHSSMLLRRSRNGRTYEYVEPNIVSGNPRLAQSLRAFASRKLWGGNLDAAAARQILHWMDEYFVTDEAQDDYAAANNGYLGDGQRPTVRVNYWPGQRVRGEEPRSLRDAKGLHDLTSFSQWWDTQVGVGTKSAGKFGADWFAANRSFRADQQQRQQQQQQRQQQQQQQQNPPPGPPGSLPRPTMGNILGILNAALRIAQGGGGALPNANQIQHAINAIQAAMRATP